MGYYPSPRHVHFLPHFLQAQVYSCFQHPPLQHHSDVCVCVCVCVGGWRGGGGKDEVCLVAAHNEALLCVECCKAAWHYIRLARRSPRSALEGAVWNRRL